jgi:hypothetical protein
MGLAEPTARTLAGGSIVGRGGALRRESVRKIGLTTCDSRANGAGGVAPDALCLIDHPASVR